MGLVYAFFRLNYDGKDKQNDLRIWKQLIPVLKLPEGLLDEPLFYQLAQIAEAEHHDYSGNYAIVRQFRDAIPANVLQALGQKGVGRPEGDTPALPVVPAAPLTPASPPASASPPIA